MNTALNNLTLNDVRTRGYAALLRELGPTGYVQFIRQFQPGRGDYTEERREWVDRTSLDELFAAIDQMRVESAPVHHEVKPSLHRFEVRPTGRDAIVGYGLETVGREQVLAEYRWSSATFRCPRKVYDAVVTVLGLHPLGITVRELLGHLEAQIGEPIPEYQARLVLRYWQRLEPPLVHRERGQYQPSPGVELKTAAAEAWDTLPVDNPSGLRE